ncbi:LexA family transcriptional regulator [Sulfuricurvum sp.]|uniref:LexA family transcriptional regulator n=1 Tax=Sulfuricurvum sp. TaxID=2025608 RepID=UPI00262D1515|nr:LexA family transcriptional regulator [Sulfuricurvum sp.]MDD2267631.1 LexA family transcriptional regulator [Sulfuricurvum sp.]MDD2784977.1 LexA family transcriptional regulator [Sulfuricurvum sp.]
MVDIDSVFDRLKHFFEIGKDIDLANKLNVTTANLAGYKRRGTIPYEQILIALENTDADLQWIFYGVESKMIQPQTAHIQYYSDIASSDGNGNIDIFGPYDMIQIDAALFPNTNIKNMMAVKINSNSMFPTFSSQDIVFIDRSKNSVLNGKPYLIKNKKGDMMIMRIFKTLNGIIAKCDNKNYPFDPEPISEEDITILGHATKRLEDIG